tara:strand:- start:278 stop:1114 length:837 start_codon:yes stop_codon:yes gene_type:complete
MAHFDLSSLAQRQHESAVAPPLSEPESDEESSVASVGGTAPQGKERDVPTSLGVQSMLGCHAALEGTTCGAILIACGEMFSPATAAFGFILVVAWIGFPNLLVLHRADWFLWITWSVFFVTWLMVFASRLVARWKYVGAKGTPAAYSGLHGALVALWHRYPFGSCVQATFVIVALFGMGALQLTGLLLVMHQANFEYDAFRYDLKAVWSVTFVVLALAHCVTIAADTLTLHQIEGAAWHHAVALSSYAAVLSTTSLPILSLFWVFYTNLCCEGDLFFR